MNCPLLKPGDGCDWCGQPLPGRRRRWCSDECSNNHWANHDWTAARQAVLARDQWTCVRCGHIGWTDIPAPVLYIASEDHHLYPHPTRPEDWAVALGFMTTDDDTWAFQYPHHYHSRRQALDQLPDIIKTLCANERPTFEHGSRHNRLHGPGAHELEVNHINPRRGRGYNNGCHHHHDNLETLCRPCHTDETNRQRRGLPSWRDDPRPIEILMGQLSLDMT